MMKSTIVYLLVILSFSCQGQNLTTRYRPLDDTGSGELILLDQTFLSSEDLSGRPYVKESFEDGLKIRREQYNRDGQLMDHNYSPAIIEYNYDDNKKVKSVLFRNKSGDKIDLDFGGYSSLEFKYDSMGRISLIKYFDKSGEPMQWIEGIDIMPAMIKYTYRGDEIIAQKLDKQMNNLEAPYKTQPPCIPFLNCN